MRAAIAVAMPVLTGGCAVQAGKAAAGDEPDRLVSARDAIRARGNEPGWNLEIRGEHLVFVTDYGQRRIEAPVVSAGPVPGGRRFESDSPELVVTLADELCHDDMTGMPYPARATVRTGDKVLRGCAGESLELLAASDWLVVAVDGEALREGLLVTISFTTDGSVFGQAPCNGFRARHELTGEHLKLGPPIVTSRMICDAGLMDLEADFLAALGAVTAFDLDNDGQLVLLDGRATRVHASKR